MVGVAVRRQVRGSFCALCFLNNIRLYVLASLEITVDTKVWSAPNRLDCPLEMYKLHGKAVQVVLLPLR